MGSEMCIRDRHHPRVGLQHSPRRALWPLCRSSVRGAKLARITSSRPFSQYHFTPQRPIWANHQLDLFNGRSRVNPSFWKVCPMPDISIHPLTKNAFAAFGDIITLKDAPDNLINQGLCGRHHDLAELDFGPDGRAGISLFNATPVSYTHLTMPTILLV